MDGIEMIETEWGSELHRDLIALETNARVEWRNSPEAREEMRRMQEAPRPEINWASVFTRPQPTKKVPIYQWNGLSR